MRLITAVLICLILPVLAIAQDEVAQPETTSVLDVAAAATADANLILDDDGEQIYPMSAERHDKLVSYSKFTSVWRFMSFFLGLLIPGLILFTGWSAKFRDWAVKIPLKFFAMWVFLVLYVVADYLLTLPFSIYRGFVVESDYGFMNQSFMEWWGESLLGLLIGAVFVIIPVWFIYLLINRTRKWWLWFSVGMIPFLVVIVVVVPIWIQPLFNEFGPIQDKALETEILALADKAGIEGADVFEVDASKQSDKINAYVTGLFGTKRIVLYDTIIRGFTTDEIKFVMAHEMGHYVKQHMWQGLALSVFFVMFLLWLSGRLIPGTINRFKGRFGFDRMGDYASWPLLLIFLSVGNFVFQPVTNSFSRYMERQSDRYGMDVSGVDGETAATAFDKLSAFNLSDPEPHPIIEFWFYSHPALTKRMEFVRTWAPPADGPNP